MIFSEFKTGDFYKQYKYIELFVMEDKNVGYLKVEDTSQKNLDDMIVEHCNSHPNGLLQISLIPQNIVTSNDTCNKKSNENLFVMGKTGNGMSFSEKLKFMETRYAKKLV